MGKENYLTTGQAAKILNVSRSTVARKFDSGILAGKRNPITQERRVSRKSLENFLRKHGLTPHERGHSPASSQKNVLIVSSNEAGYKPLVQCLDREAQTETTLLSSVSDALLLCAEKQPDLVIIGRDLGEIPCAYLAQGLKKNSGLSRTKILCCAKGQKEPLCLDVQCEAHEHFSGPLRNVDLLRKSIDRLVGHKKDSTPGKKISPLSEKRHHQRLSVQIPANFEIFRSKRSSRPFRGRGFVQNISEKGAFLSHLQTNSGYLPCGAFSILLKVDDHPLLKWEAHCRVTRLLPDRVVTAGLEFLGLTKTNAKKLKNVLSQLSTPLHPRTATP